MNVDELQAKKLIACGAVHEAQLRQLWALPPSQPGLDLCGRLLERGWISPQLAQQIRQEVAYENHVQTRLDSDSSIQESVLASSRRSSSGSFLRSSTASFRVPPSAIGPYQIEREIARGGMGIVYLAHHPQFPNPLAVKVLTGQRDKDFERFEVEVMASKRLSHENIVKIHDAGREQGTPYMVMDYIEGQPLDEYLTEVDAIDIDLAVEWTIAIAEALSHAHENDILHRDLKPANVLLDNSDPPIPLLTDFGVAKLEDDDSKNLTNSGEMIGTPQYMPPEQAEGHRDLMGPASDVYSLGATLYEMLTGRPPFNAPTMLDLMVKISMAKPDAPSDIVHTIPKDLEAIIMKCLEKQISRRYENCRDLAEDLVRFQRGEEVEASYRSLGATVSHWLLMVVGVVVIAAAVLGAVIYFSPEEKALIEPSRLRLASEPSGLTFQIHGKDRNYTLTAPGTLEVPPGQYTIDLDDKRFQKDHPDWKEIQLSPGQEHDLILKPRWRFGSLACKARAHKTLKISGHHVDFPDIQLNNALLPLKDQKLVAGRWRFQTEVLGHFPQEFEVEINEGQTTIAHVAPASQILWTISINDDDDKGETLSKPLVQDLDGDGRVEIAVSSAKNIFVLSPSYEVISAFTIDGSQHILEAFDFNKDGIKDLVALNKKGELVICNLVTKKTREISGAKVTRAFYAEDLNGDDNPELIFPITPKQLAVMPSGKIKNLSTWSDHKVESGTPTFHDLDGDGFKEILVPDAEGWLYALNEELKEKWKTKLPGTLGFVAVEDFDPSDGQEILYVSKLDDEFLIHCLSRDRSKLWVHKIPHYPVTWLACGQFKKGGLNEYILGGPKKIACFSKQKQLWSFEIKTGAITAFECIDLNKDGVDEVLVGFSDGTAGCLSNGFDFKWKFKLEGQINGFGAADFDADGDAEIVISSANGQIMCVEGFKTTRLTTRPYPLKGQMPPQILGPWLTGPGATAFHAKTWDRFQVTTTKADGTKKPLKMRSPMAWDAARKDILVPNKHFIQQWNPAKRQFKTRIKKPFVAGLTVSKDQLIAGSLRGKIASFDLSRNDDLITPDWKYTVAGRVEAPALALDFDNDQNADHFLFVTTAGKLLLLTKSGEKVDLKALPGPSIYTPVILKQDGDQVEVLVSCRNGALLLFQASPTGLQKIRKMQLDFSIAAEPVVIRKDGVPQSIAVPIYGHALWFVDSALKKLIEIDHRQGCWPFGGVTVIDADGDGVDEFAASWLWVTKLGSRSTVVLYNQQGQRLTEVFADDKISFVTRNSKKELMAVGDSIVTWKTWKSLNPIKTKPDLDRAFRFLIHGAYDRALKETSRYKRKDKSRALIEALALWHMGSTDPLQKMRKTEPEFIKQTMKQWGSQIEGQNSELAQARLLEPVGLRIVTKDKEFVSLDHLKVKSNGKRGVNFTGKTIKQQGLSKLEVIKELCGTGKGDRRKLGLVFKRNGVLKIEFNIDKAGPYLLGLKHRSLPQYIIGSSVIAITLNNLPLYTLWEAPSDFANLDYVEIFQLGQLAPGKHVIEIKNLPGYATLYALEQAEILPKK